MKELLHKIQSHFGQITKEKVTAFVLVALIWLIPSIGLAIAYAILPEGGRIGLTVLTGVAIAAYLVIRFRKHKRIKIPIKKTSEEYVTVDKPITAEIPISAVSAEKPYISTSHGTYQPMYNASPPKTLQMEEVELSQFARKRIAEECYLNVQYAAYEIRKPAKELYFQLKKRLRTIEEVGEEKDKTTGKVRTKTRTTREPRSTIYGEILFVLIAICILSSPLLVGIFTLPEWAMKLYAPIRESQVAPLIVFGVGCTLMIWSAFLLYSKWSYWYYWRQVLLPPNKLSGDPGGLVIINKPPLLGGKVTLASLRKVNQCYTSTAPKDQEEKGLRSLFLRILGLRWMIVDIQGDKDKHVNLMGPFEHSAAAKASRIINNLSADTPTQERE